MLEYSNLTAFKNMLSIIEDGRTVRKRCRAPMEYCLHVEAVVNHFIRNPNPLVVPVYRFGIIRGDVKDIFSEGRYYYDMQRLAMLSNDEISFIDSTFETYYRHGISDDYWTTLEKDNFELARFLREVIKQDRYQDGHSGNFLKDESGNYKIIDLEGFVAWELNNNCNDWIRQ